MLETPSQSEVTSHLPTEVLEVSRRYAAITDPQEKESFVNDAGNYQPVLKWYCTRVREKFLSLGEESHRVESLLYALYDSQNLPQDQDWFGHMQKIAGTVDLSEADQKKLLEVFNSIRADLIGMRSELIRISGSDYIPSHVLAGFHSAVEVATI
jgi:hypothetical protein